MPINADKALDVRDDVERIMNIISQNQGMNTDKIIENRILRTSGGRRGCRCAGLAPSRPGPQMTAAAAPHPAVQVTPTVWLTHEVT